MTEAKPGEWETFVVLSPGSHRANVRIDGDRWVVPPGLPSIEDEFEGRVGVFVVPAASR
jgi:hypothetical protein